MTPGEALDDLESVWIERPETYLDDLDSDPRGVAEFLRKAADDER